MIVLLKNGFLYSPYKQGYKDILVASGKIVEIADSIEIKTDINRIEVLDLTGKYVVPGFIDQHVHICGGGGEMGYTSRTLEIDSSELLSNGITTVVGCLGLDGVTRSVETLLVKSHALEEEGLTCYIYTGLYQVPTLTLTGNVRSDIYLVKNIIGVGEIAISDHRSTQPSVQELKRIASEARVGGILSGKAGVVHVHVGDGNKALGPLFEVVSNSEIPISQFMPTHVNRNEKVLEDGVRFVEEGGYIDITSSINTQASLQRAIKASKAVKYLLDKGVPIERITMSSDGNGSMPVYDECGSVISQGVASVGTLFKEIKDCVIEEGIPLEQALLPITNNVSTFLKLGSKGKIISGNDADMIVLDKNLQINMVMSKGEIYKQDKILLS